MTQVYVIDIVNEAFRLARDQFEAMIRELHSDPTAQMEHDHLEALIKKQGTEYATRFSRSSGCTLQT
jgi:hypothetical protein